MKACGLNTLVIDVGTSSMRGIVFGAGGEKRFSHQVPYCPTYLEGGRVEQDASSFVSALIACASAAAAFSAESSCRLDLVALTSQRSSITAVGAAGEPLMPFIMWQDTRNAALVEELARHGDRIFALSGTKVNTVFSGAKMGWVERELSEVAARTRRYATIPELLLHAMTGEWRCDQTYASRSNLMNIRSRSWDEELLGIFGVPAGKLSEIVAPGSAVGCVSAAFAGSTGLAAGTPVVSAGGDQQCGALGQGVVGPGSVSVVAGTGAFLETVVDEVPEDLRPDVVCNASALAGQYTLEASVPACCSAFDWYRREFCADLGFEDIARVVREEHAACEPGVVLPHFQGRGTPDWNPRARGVFAGLDLSTTREGLLYALLAGIFTEVRANLDSFERYVALEHGSISGGLTQTPEINQLQADVYGFGLTRQEDAESTARGALVSALAGQGVYPSPRVSYDAVAGGLPTSDYVPDAAKHRKLGALKRHAEALYESMAHSPLI